MKKIIALGLALFASSALAAVSSTKHNMNTYIGSGTADVCYFCHAAHNAQPNTRGPLWARLDPTTTYTYYTSPTVSSNSPTLGISLSCLSCHDGSIAVNTTIKGTNVSTGPMTYVGQAGKNPNKKIGPNVSNDHPIGLVYNPAAAPNAGLAAASAISPFRLYGASGTIECASCHAVHGGVGTAAIQFMRVDPASGNFCAQCHATK